MNLHMKLRCFVILPRDLKNYKTWRLSAFAVFFFTAKTQSRKVKKREEMKKHFAYNSARQLWRILITDTDKLLLETRDKETKEVFFHCYELQNGEKTFTDLQMEEKYWLGIEAIYKDIIYFHKFPKPDLPGHREIIAFDIKSQKVLWTNTQYAFQFAYQDKIYCFTQGFEEKYFFSLDCLTGEMKEELGSNYTMMNQLRAEADASINWIDYIYPNRLSESDDIEIKNLIESKTKKLQLAGEIEFGISKDLLLSNVHEKTDNGKYDNRFIIINRRTSDVIFEELLNENVASFYTDSFFVYKDFLFLLKAKTGVDVYCLE